MTMNVSVVNSNRYSMRVETIDLTASLMANVTQLKGVRLGFNSAPLNPKEGEGRSVGGGLRATPITFPPTQNTTFQMDFNLAYETTPDFVDDLAFAELLQGCGFLYAPRRPMRVEYRANAVVDFFRRFGYTPRFVDDLNVNCPGPIGQQLMAFNLTAYGLNTTVPRRSTSTTNRIATVGRVASDAGDADFDADEDDSENLAIEWWPTH
ncbi:hypothetical protein BC831DRAFT_451370 [Entophlyctis helioformis]|nr:hypothetical protein BC831DRAFT_451370 [Entophlyctis helioformis]